MTTSATAQFDLSLFIQRISSVTHVYGLTRLLIDCLGLRDAEAYTLLSGLSETTVRQVLSGKTPGRRRRDLPTASPRPPHELSTTSPRPVHDLCDAPKNTQPHELSTNIFRHSMHVMSLCFFKDLKTYTMPYNTGQQARGRAQPHEGAVRASATEAGRPLPQHTRTTPDAAPKPARATRPANQLRSKGAAPRGDSSTSPAVSRGDEDLKTSEPSAREEHVRTLGQALGFKYSLEVLQGTYGHSLTRITEVFEHVAALVKLGKIRTPGGMITHLLKGGSGGPTSKTGTERGSAAAAPTRTSPPAPFTPGELLWWKDEPHIFLGMQGKFGKVGVQGAETVAELVSLSQLIAAQQSLPEALSGARSPAEVTDPPSSPPSTFGAAPEASQEEPAHEGQGCTASQRCDVTPSPVAEGAALALEGRAALHTSATRDPAMLDKLHDVTERLKPSPRSARTSKRPPPETQVNEHASARRAVLEAVQSEDQGVRDFLAAHTARPPRPRPSAAERIRARR